MAGEKALLRWFEEKRAALTAQVSSLKAERNRILNELGDIDSSLERERFRLEIVDEFAAEAGAIISNRVSPEMDDPKHVLSAAVGGVKKDKKVQEIVPEIVEQVEGSDST